MSEKSNTMMKIALFLSIMLSIGMILTLFLLTTNLQGLRSDREYYKDQMLDFCEIAQIQEDIINQMLVLIDEPEEELMILDCTKWQLESDGGRE